MLTPRLSRECAECLRWLHVNLVLSPGVPCSSEQLRQLADAVGDNDVSRPTATTVGQAPCCCGVSIGSPSALLVMTDVGPHSDGGCVDDVSRRGRIVVREDDERPTLGQCQGAVVSGLLSSGERRAVERVWR
jgi:hypothetical protein